MQSLLAAIGVIILPKHLQASTLRQSSFKGSIVNNGIKLIDLNLEDDTPITFHTLKFVYMIASSTEGINIVNFDGIEYRVTNSLADIRNGLTR